MTSYRNIKSLCAFLRDASEQELRDFEMPTPKSIAHLESIVTTLSTREHDYGTCVYAMSLASVAVFNYVASGLGVTGFQASCADLDIIKRTRNLDCPFMLIRAADMLYPQYDIMGKVSNALNEWKPWAKERALKLLEGEHPVGVHPDVMNRWKELAR